MDERRLDTAAVLASGIINLRPPTTDIPQERESVNASGEYCSYVGTEAVVNALESGKLVEAPNYYGIPYVWKVSDGVYRGTLLQYRAVTEDITFTTATEAAEWFEERYYATDG